MIYAVLSVKYKMKRFYANKVKMHWVSLTLRQDDQMVDIE